MGQLPEPAIRRIRFATDKDRIERRVPLRASLGRVWRAVSDARQFGDWFGVAFDGPFVSGARTAGTIVPTQVDEVVGKPQKPCEGRVFDFTVDRIVPERPFSFRWPLSLWIPT
jgi:uncharacterized protein YndB with AHSA1/START domain